ncbi:MULTISPECIES: hypothetical protein [Cyanophyceae]|uniref:Uncharacterized protein n=1 Tax=Leptolyngbya subtilissima DQ-A4 TaxID=2933933 RepID=A0ABV0K9L2_9CYAN|nr:hypothetical protein [Nodosilinea sp. FACHB-141]MBD2114254.1 hypothetical protein [Nodosilinea sp. FACHB-141]
MKNSKTLHLSILLAIAAVLAAGSAQAAASAGQLQAPISAGADAMLKCDNEISQNYAQTELETFFSSGYTYWDAAQLASYWGQDVDEAKARIGRKILWGPADVALLEQFLLDARLESLQSVDDLRFYSETSYTYDDAAALAEFWGDATPYDAKLRIERNLIMGNADEVEYALELANSQP